MVVLLISVLLLTEAFSQTIPSCPSRVYCQGDLLHTVQMAKLYKDSKTFVDMKMKNDEETTLKNFEKFQQTTNNNPTKDDVQKFVNDNFALGDEFEAWTPEDHTDTPKILTEIEDEEVRGYIKSLVGIWPQLARKIKQEVKDNQNLYTLLPIKNGFMVPGGRFREFYYWDSYWIVTGLLLSDMHLTVKGMLDNFLLMVTNYGFLPNGARIYYLNRSQPPLLSLMVKNYIDATNDLEWLKANIQTIEKELQFWLHNKTVEVRKNGETYQVAHYSVDSGSPRPESYYEDFTTAQYLPNDVDKTELWKDLKSGAESGWDFSSRWIVDENGGNVANLTYLQTRRIIPVDLNAFLCQAFRTVAEFFTNLNDLKKANFWFDKATQWQKTIEQVFWDSTDGMWYDFDSKLEKPRKYFFPSNFAPLWAKAFDPSKANELGKSATDYFYKMKVDQFQGGIPASLDDTHEQWDYPNAWPPLQSLVILGLDNTGNCDAKKLAKTLADRWITANMIGFNNTGEMFEKYDAVTPGQYGGGGEYVVQSGFGWSNGVIFEFVERFHLNRTSKN